MSFKKIKATEIGENIAELFAHRPTLLTAGTEDKFNTMIIGWGGIGPLWFRMTATVYVRQSRYTFEFMESGDYYTICFFDKSMARTLAVCGEKSGRDVDKLALTGLTPVKADCGAVYFEQASTVVVCRKLYKKDFAPEDFVTDEVPKEYGYEDFHRMYIGEIVEVLERI